LRISPTGEFDALEETKLSRLLLLDTTPIEKDSIEYKESAAKVKMDTTEYNT
jgi:hypothetical protein